ncbi:MULTISPECIES: ATPase [unclassified Pseudomonas]|uniref:ATPase n=1 Tax=unclassified Pseudomonas TaxID=196821 RepID=UPI000D3325F0|nr:MULTISPECIES: ATPase [unclassified Pseudomonas]RAU44616.1 ATPase [Pseudomonas sp. RIT 409]RAU54948.1 ATPase [Pseudomonas sp. RIT 412]
MRISTLLTLVAVLTGGLVAAVPASAATSAADEPICHFMPMADSGVGLSKSQSVGVLYSENTVATLNYLEHYHAVAVKGVKNGALDSRIREAFVNSSDPKLAIDWLKASIAKEFASVTVYDNLDALMKARPDVVVMLDTYSQLVTQRNSKVEARFVAKFYDANLQYIGKAEGLGTQELSSVWGHDKAAPEIAAQINQQRELQVDALKRFDMSLKALVTSGEVAQVAGN